MNVKNLKAAGLAAALMFGAAGPASAQAVAPTAPTVETQRPVVVERDDGFNWGWLGLLGLVGLAGLAGRKKSDTVHHADTTRTADVNRTNVYDKR